VVFNERNLIRLWDISYDGYVGGKDASILDWGSDSDLGRFIRADNNLSMPYGGPSIVVLPIPTKVHTLPSPLPIANLVNRTLSSNAHALATADLFVEDMTAFLNRTAEKTGSEHIDGIQNAISVAYDMLHLHRNSAASKCAGLASMENEATLVRLAYGGTYSYKLSTEVNWNDISGLFPLFHLFSFSCRCFISHQRRCISLVLTTCLHFPQAVGTMVQTTSAPPAFGAAKASATLAEAPLAPFKSSRPLAAAGCAMLNGMFL
jgi:hypothetical protein